MVIDRTQPARDAAAARLGLRLARLVAAAGAVTTVTLVVVTLLVWVGRGFETLPVSFGRTALGVVGLVFASVCYAIFGALLAIRVPRNPIGWLFLATGFAFGSMLPVNLLVAATGEALRPADPALVLVAWARTTFATPLVLTLLIISGYLFPTGRPISASWWAGIVATILAGLLLSSAAALNPEGLITYPSIPNPLATPASLAPVVRIAMATAVAMLLVTMACALISLVVRYRRGSNLVRAQLKWILLAVSLAVLTASPFLLFRYVVLVSDGLGEASAMLAQVGSCAFPIAAAFAVTRYRLYEIDVLIGRTLVYVPLMGILAGLYTASITLFQRLFETMTGGRSDLALVLTMLVLAGGFAPIRGALETAVARRYKLAAAGPAETAVTAGAAGRVARSITAGGSLAPDPVASAWDNRTSNSALPATSQDRPPRVRGTLRALVPVASFLRVDADGTVPCPNVGAAVAVARCLSCPKLQAIVRGSGTGVVCTARAPT